MTFDGRLLNRIIKRVTKISEFEVERTVFKWKKPSFLQSGRVFIH